MSFSILGDLNWFAVIVATIVYFGLGGSGRHGHVRLDQTRRDGVRGDQCGLPLRRAAAGERDPGALAVTVRTGGRVEQAADRHTGARQGVGGAEPHHGPGLVDRRGVAGVPDHRRCIEHGCVNCQIKTAGTNGSKIVRLGCKSC